MTLITGEKHSQNQVKIDFFSVMKFNIRIRIKIKNFFVGKKWEKTSLTAGAVEKG